MAKSLDDLLKALPGPAASLDHIEGHVVQRMATARVSDARLKGVIGINLSVALAALVVGTTIGFLRSVHPALPENNVNLVLTDIPRSALVD
jgi:hypothetical protein